MSDSNLIEIFSLVQPYLLYLHGFNSSPQSYKAQLVKRWLRLQHPQLEIKIPALPVSPCDAIRHIESLCFSVGAEPPFGIIGSSLGGYYALYLSCRYGVPAGLINPAIYPYRLLKDYLGPNTNLYTGEVYELGAQHMEELLAIDTPPPSHTQQVLTLLQTGDQTLDYGEAVAKFRFHPLWVQPGGGHEFEDFEKTLPAIQAFFQRFNNRVLG